MRRIKWVLTSLSVGILSACTSSRDIVYTDYQPYQYPESQFYSQNYMQTYNGVNDYADERPRSSEVNVPNSYYVGSNYSPARAKDADRTWVDKQSPQHYTIVVADDEKPARVATKLYQLPKKDRAAEVKYQRNGKSYYQGVYGSYSSKEDAEKALRTLPDEVKQQAKVNDWNSVQHSLSE